MASETWMINLQSCQQFIESRKPIQSTIDFQIKSITIEALCCVHASVQSVISAKYWPLNFPSDSCFLCFITSAFPRILHFQSCLEYLHYALFHCERGTRRYRYFKIKLDVYQSFRFSRENFQSISRRARNSITIWNVLPEKSLIPHATFVETCDLEYLFLILSVFNPVSVAIYGIID